MNVLLDLNVLLDVIQERRPHYDASSNLVREVVDGSCVGHVPGHGITTIHYIVTRYADQSVADASVDWLLDRFEVATIRAIDFRKARTLEVKDFEDAVVAATADRIGCDYIASRNVEDFGGSPVEAMPPALLLDVLRAENE